MNSFGGSDDDDFGEIDPQEAAGGRRRRWPLLCGAGAVVVVVVALLAWQPWDDGAGDAEPTPPVMTERLVLPGLEPTGAVLENGAQALPDDEIPDDGYVFSTPDATLEKGPLLVFLVESVENEQVIDGEGDADAVDINGSPATVEEFEGSIEVYWSPEPGVRYGVAGAGFPRARVLAFARAVSLEGGITILDDDSVIDGLEPQGGVDTLFDLFGMAAPEFRGASGVTFVQYRSDDGDLVAVASAPTTDDGALAVAAFLLQGDAPGQVHGQPAVIGALDGVLATDADQRLVVWVEGGRMISVSAALDDDELLAIAEATRTATDDEWDVVLDAAAKGELERTDEGGDTEAGSIST